MTETRPADEKEEEEEDEKEEEEKEAESSGVKKSSNQWPNISRESVSLAHTD